MRGREAGQATVEWTGLVLLVAVLLGGLGLAAPKLAGWRLGSAVLRSIVCAIQLGCREDASLDEAYGAQLAAEVRKHAPNIVYERDSAGVPIDFRICRKTICSDGSSAAAEVDASLAGLQATGFTRVIDRRAQGGYLYLQYWFFYPTSFTGGIGRTLGPLSDRWPGYHPDDWEGVQMRIDRSGGVEARASAHGGYRNGKHSTGWGKWSGWYRVSGGSHAGHLVRGPTGERSTSKSSLSLVPIETLPDKDLYHFAISPPWQKSVYTNPESPSS